MRRKEGGIKMLAGGITKIHSDVATGLWGIMPGGRDNRKGGARGRARRACRLSVPWGGRNPDSQSAGLGLDTCCFGDHQGAWRDRND